MLAHPIPLSSWGRTQSADLVTVRMEDLAVRDTEFSLGTVSILTMLGIIASTAKVQSIGAGLYKNRPRDYNTIKYRASYSVWPALVNPLEDALGILD